MQLANLTVKMRDFSCPYYSEHLNNVYKEEGVSQGDRDPPDAECSAGAVRELSRDVDSAPQAKQGSEPVSPTFLASARASARAIRLQARQSTNNISLSSSMSLKTNTKTPQPFHSYFPLLSFVKDDYKIVSSQVKHFVQFKLTFGFS